MNVPAFEFTYPIIEITNLDRLLRYGVSWVPVSYSATHQLLHKEFDPDVTTAITHEDLGKELSLGISKIEYGHRSIADTKMRLLFGNRTVNDFPEKSRRLAILKEALVLRYEEECRELGTIVSRGPSLEPFLVKWWAELEKEYEKTSPGLNDEPKSAGKVRKRRAGSKKTTTEAPSLRSFNLMYNEYLNCDRDIRAFLPRYKGPSVRHNREDICPESMALWRAKAKEFASSRKPTKVRLLLELESKIHELNVERKEKGLAPLQVPGRTRFRNLISKLDQFEVDAARQGRAWAIARHRPRMSGYDIERAGARGEFDCWKAHIFTVIKRTPVWDRLSQGVQAEIERDRIWLSACKDAATRYLLGLKATRTTKAEAVIATLDMAMSDKTHISRYVGSKTPWIGMARLQSAYSDNGSEYLAENTRQTFAAARIDFTRPPAGQPWKRPFIESLFNTFEEQFMGFFDGRSFNNIMEKGEYDAKQNATLIVDEFIALFIRWICDVYHNTPMQGLNGNTPHGAWVESTKKYPIRDVPRGHERRSIFGTTISCKLSTGGVGVFGIPYNSDELQAYRRKKGSVSVDVKFHRTSLDGVSVFIPGTGWIPVPNRIGIDPTVSLEEWLAAKQSLKNRNAHYAEQGREATFEAINTIRRVSDAAALRAGISLHVPTAEDYRKMNVEMFEGRILEQVEGDVSPVQLAQVENNADPLFDDSIEVPKATGKEGVNEDEHVEAEDDDYDHYGQ